MTPGARVQAALDLLESLAARPVPADAAAGAYFRGRRYIGAKDRGAIAALLYGVLRHRAQLAWWIGRADAALPAVPRTLTIAWLALGESWPAGEIAAAFDGGRFRPWPLSAAEAALAGFLSGRTLFHPEQPDWIRFNYPQWLHPAFAAQFGSDLPREMAALAAPAPLDLRVNALKASRDEVLAELRAAGLDAEATALSPWGIRVQGRPPLGALAAFQSGRVEVQDEGSQLAAALVDARPGLRVCDFCAGAGGKTLALAAAMENKGHIVACDVSGRRMEGAIRRLRRAGVHNVQQQALSGERDPWVKRHRARFDRVLVDAPCTGTGTWRRNPDAKWTLRGTDLDELAALQRRILDSAARLVRPGGRLVYVTCSLLAAENEAQAAWFAESHPDFAAVPVADVWAQAIGGRAPPGGTATLRLSPARHNTDGFFVAIFEKRPHGSGPSE